MYQDLLVPMITNVGQENVFKREILFVALEVSELKLHELI